MYGGQVTSASAMNTSWGSNAMTVAPGHRRPTLGNKNALKAVTMSGLGVVGGMMAGKAIASGDDKPSWHPKAVAQKLPPPQHQAEHNYTQFVHGSNANAQLKPVTYDTFKGSSVLAQTGSTKSSPTAPSHPQRQRPHRPHAQGGFEPPGYGAAMSTHAVAGSAVSSNSNSGVSMSGPSGENKPGRQQWPHSSQPVSGVLSSSLHVFDNSVGAHTMTSSVLALNSASHNQSHQQKRPNPQRQGGQPVAGQGVPNTYASSGAMYSLPSTAWTPDTATTTGGRFDPNVLESDMAAAGFTPMHSKYKSTKQGKSSYSTQPSQSHQPTSNLVYNQVQQPMPAPCQHQPHQYTHQVGSPNPALLQQQQQTSAGLTQSLAPVYPSQHQHGPQPIAVPNQALAAPHVYPSHTNPLIHSQVSLAEHGGQYYMQHQKAPWDALSQSAPATYDPNNQPLGLASSVQNITHSLPQLMHVSSDNIPQPRPKKRVHFADNC